MHLLPGAVGGAVAGVWLEAEWTSVMPGSCWSTAIMTSSWTTSQLGWRVMGIERDLPEISGGDQIIEGLRGLLLVERVLRDDGAQSGQVRAQNRLTGLYDRLVVDRHGNRHQDHDDEDDDHQLEQRESASACLLSANAEGA